MIIGFFLGLVLDKFYQYKEINKYEKGFEYIEHYHFGLIAGIIGIITSIDIFTGLGMSLILAEWSQDHHFAYGSNHFKLSTIMGLILFAILIGIYLIKSMGIV